LGSEREWVVKAEGLSSKEEEKKVEEDSLWLMKNNKLRPDIK